MKQKQIIELIRLLNQDPKQIDAFLEISFSDKELQNLRDRWEIFKLISEGKTQRETAKAVESGIATVTRGSKVFRKNETFILNLLNLLQEKNV